MNLYSLEYVNLNNSRSTLEVQAFLAHFELSYNAQDVEFTLVLRDGDKIIATGSFSGVVLRNIAIDNDRQGEGLTAQVLTELIQELARRGRFHYFLYTKPESAWLFKDVGLKELIKGEYAALLEGGIGSLSQYLAALQQQLAEFSQPRAALVMNCNPFTLGHRYLIEKAAAENKVVIVFVVSEEGSVFPFSERFQLVKAGTADLKNVVVIPTDAYQVSKATFPTYFTKAEHHQLASTELDVRLFAEKIAPTLNINHRYVGEEPYCEVTESYNLMIKQWLPASGIKLTVVPRHLINGRVVSASKVREKLSEKDFSAVKEMVPATTYQYLISPECEAIINSLKSHLGRH